MKYRLKTTNRFDKQLKQCLKRGYNEHFLEEVLEYILDGRPLPRKYKQHRLNSKFANCWECHITPDWLLLWQEYEDELTLLLLETGTHSDVFG